MIVNINEKLKNFINDNFKIEISNYEVIEIDTRDSEYGYYAVFNEKKCKNENKYIVFHFDKNYRLVCVFTADKASIKDFNNYKLCYIEYIESYDNKEEIYIRNTKSLTIGDSYYCFDEYPKYELKYMISYCSPLKDDSFLYINELNIVFKLNNEQSTLL